VDIFASPRTVAVGDALTPDQGVGRQDREHRRGTSVDLCGMPGSAQDHRCLCRRDAFGFNEADEKRAAKG
jgi:hypothetical protein